ncbi:ABC transporter permease [Methyloligella sp. 2.7D]|uniref:ABC transporter permease n=1 Tax=unclassified Methyloligella TaxID=2625955 RepID=UPI00157C0339|nr:ABC transporter permease [Methyloligella sp. GL2]QKP76673.1 ABC transporter permease [Methyloligella sp. GL2]
MKRPGFNFWGLLPAQLIMLLTMIIPIGIIVVVSFSTRGAYGGFDYIFSLESYQRLLFSVGWTDELEFNPQYLLIIGRTILLAATTTAICLLISFPAAYFIAQRQGQLKVILLYLVTLPFWVSMIVRVYAWLIILGKNGVIDGTLSKLGIVDNLGSLLFNNGAMLVGLVYSYVPLMILPVYASIEKLDPALIEASHDLYGGRWKTLFRVIAPLCKPGMVAGAVLVFIPSLGAVIEPMLLGGGKKMMMGNLILNQFGMDRNWPFGAAVAVVMMGLVMAVMILNALRAARKQAETA